MAPNKTEDFVEPEVDPFPPANHDEMRYFVAVAASLTFLARTVTSRRCLMFMEKRVGELHGILHKRLAPGRPRK